MPLTKKGKAIFAAMKEQYGPKKAKQVFYAAENKGTIKGVHSVRKAVPVALPRLPRAIHVHTPILAYGNFPRL